MSKTQASIVRFFSIGASLWNGIWLLYLFWIVGGEAVISKFLYYYESNIPMEIVGVLVEIIIVGVFVVLSSPIWAAPFWLCRVVRTPWKFIANGMLLVLLSFLVITMANDYLATGLDNWTLYYFVECIVVASLTAVKVCVDIQ